MHFKSKLLSNLSKVFSGIAAYALFQIVISSLLSKLYGTQQLAEYLFIFSLSSTVFFLTNLGLRQVLITSSEYSNYFDYYKIRLLSSCVAFLCIAIIYSLSPFHDYKLFFFLLVIKIFESLSEINFAIKQKNEEHGYQSNSLLLKSLVSIFSFCVAWALGLDVADSFGVILVVHLAVFFFYELQGLPKFCRSFYASFFSLHINWHLMKYALPLGIGMFLINLNLNFPRIFSGIYLSEYDTAGIGACIQIALAGAPIITGITQTLLPRFTILVHENMFKEVNKLFNKCVLMVFVMGMLGVVISYFFGEALLGAVFNSEIASYSNIFFLICIAIACNYISAISTLMTIVFGRHKINLCIMALSFSLGLVYLFCMANITVIDISVSLIISALVRLFLSYSYGIKLLRGSL